MTFECQQWSFPNEMIARLFASRIHCLDTCVCMWNHWMSTYIPNQSGNDELGGIMLVYITNTALLPFWASQRSRVKHQVWSQNLLKNTSASFHQSIKFQIKDLQQAICMLTSIKHYWTFLCVITMPLICHDALHCLRYLMSLA
jgi:hypothetical protein